MSDGDVFAHHHDFFGTQPAQEPQQDDTKERERAHNRRVIANTFTTPEGRGALTLIETLASTLPAHPIQYQDSDKATQMLWWRAARVALIDEIKEIIRQETQR